MIIDVLYGISPTARGFKSQDLSVRELMIIDIQDGTLENDIRYGDGDKMKWSENTTREEVRQTGTDAKKGAEGQKKETLREERRRVQERPKGLSKLLRVRA